MPIEPCLDCFNPGIDGLVSTKGDGKCAACSGTGQTIAQNITSFISFSLTDEYCVDCDGTGICSSCDGTGWLD